MNTTDTYVFEEDTAETSLADVPDEQMLYLWIAIIAICCCTPSIIIAHALYYRNVNPPSIHVSRVPDAEDVDHQQQIKLCLKRGGFEITAANIHR